MGLYGKTALNKTFIMFDAVLRNLQVPWMGAQPCFKCWKGILFRFANQSATCKFLKGKTPFRQFLVRFFPNYF